MHRNTLYRIAALLFSLLLFSFPSFSQGNLDSLLDYCRDIGTFSRLFPQEKVYLHLDNTGYFKGEKIWFKAYVVRTDGKREDLSRTLYVELLDPVGEVFEKQKLRIENGECHGDFTLSGRPPGFWEIRAYTRYSLNWDGAACFSRVVPVFDNKGSDSLAIRVMRNLQSYNRSHVLYGMTDPEEVKKLPKRLRKRMVSFHVNDTAEVFNATPFLLHRDVTGASFYPEGGSLVEGLPSVVAFQLNEEAAYSSPHEGTLQDSLGNVLQVIRTLHEGRGSFPYEPDGKPRFACFGDKRFALPAAEKEGCVMLVDAVHGDQVTVRIRRSARYAGDTLGLTLLHQGCLEWFMAVSSDTLLALPRADLPAGVSQLTLFTASGRILSDRLFFVTPREEDLTPVRITVPDSLSHYGRLDLGVKAPAGSRLSVSVTDYDRRNAPRRSGGLASWFLLTSELKGYVHDADYYVEADDPVHRTCADLLMRVQGWRRYRWEQVSNSEPFVVRQPVEDGLYLDGRVLHRDRPDREARLQVAVLNNLLDPLIYDVVPDSGGYYAVRFPDDLTGKWPMQLTTFRGDRIKEMDVLVDRHFSPEKREFSLREVDLVECGEPSNVFRPRLVDTHKKILHQMSLDKYQLDEAVVKRKKKRKEYSRFQKQLELEEDLKTSGLHIYYNLREVEDEFMDKGLKSMPTLLDWLGQKDYIRREMDKGRIYLIEDVIFNSCQALGISLSVNDTLVYLRGRPEGMEPGSKHYEDVRTGIGTVCIERIYDASGENEKGIRRSSYLGYNVPEVFQWNNYDQFPPVPDYRRTLYWNPNVPLDSLGHAKLTFHNSSTCEKLQIVVEGITRDGKPIVGTFDSPTYPTDLQKPDF